MFESKKYSLLTVNNNFHIEVNLNLVISLAMVGLFVFYLSQANKDNKQ
jgi:hypothetical protein